MACCLLGGTRSRPGTTNNANGGSADGGNHNGNTGVANSGGVAGVGVNTGANGDNGNGGIGGQGGFAGMPGIASTVSSVVASTVLPSFTTPLAVFSLPSCVACGRGQHEVSVHAGVGRHLLNGRNGPTTTNNANGGSADGGNHNGNTGVANSGGVAGVGVNTGANGDNGNGGIGGQGGFAGMPGIASTVSSVGTTTVLPQGELENTAKYSKWRWKDHKMLQRHLLCFLNPLVQPASRALMALDCLNVGTCNRAAVCLLLTWD